MIARRRVTPRGDVTAIVLTGGRSGRFGGPKLAAWIDGMTVLDRALLAVDQVAGTIVVAGGAPAVRPPLVAPLRVVVDREPFAGPLAALSGALPGIGSAFAIVVGGDMPALVPDVLRLLVDRLRDDGSLEAVILESPAATSGAAAKTAVLPVALRVEPAIAAATAALAHGDRSLVRLLGRLAVESIPADDWLPLDPEARTLADVDTPADLIGLRGNEIR